MVHLRDGTDIEGASQELSEGQRLEVSVVSELDEKAPFTRVLEGDCWTALREDGLRDKAARGSCGLLGQSAVPAGASGSGRGVGWDGPVVSRAWWRRGLEGEYSDELRLAILCESQRRIEQEQARASVQVEPFLPTLGHGSGSDSSGDVS